jgi:hypothetical protein
MKTISPIKAMSPIRATCPDHLILVFNTPIMWAYKTNVEIAKKIEYSPSVDKIQ